MAVQTAKVKTTLKLMAQDGTLANGAPKYVQKTFGNVNPEVTDENLLGAGKGIATLLEGDYDVFHKVEEISMTEV